MFKGKLVRLGWNNSSDMLDILDQVQMEML